jgi:hypothetical protein
MKHILTFALSMAMLCSLALPASADIGKGSSGKSSLASPKTKRPKEKNPQPTTPTNPTTPTTPPVILRQPQSLTKPALAKPTLNKSQNSAPLTTQVLGKPKLAKSEVPPNLSGQDAEKFQKHSKNRAPFLPDLWEHLKKKHDHDCHDDDHGGKPNPPPLDPGKGDGKPPSQNPPPRDGYVCVPAHGDVPGHWERERAPSVPQAKPGFVWVPATATVPGHWERVRAK